jgi:hypothetical protein
LRPGFNYEPTKGINIKGISEVLLKTKGTVLLKLFTLTQETTHLFHVMGEDFDCRYDRILGQDFWKDKRATESVVRLPTKSKGFGITSKGEIVPGVYFAEALTKGGDGYCVTTIVNTSEGDVTT